VIVVGLGAMGSAACCQLSKRGVSVIGIDRYSPPHELGSTHGETRITRLATGEGSEYVPLVKRSHELWRELEAESDTTLMTQTGILVLGHATSRFLERTRAVAREHSIEHRELTNGELQRLHPMFAVDEQTEAYYEPEGGYVRPEAAVSVQLELAGRHGACLKLGERVLSWSASSGGVRVTTTAGSYSAGRLVLCAGAWITELFPAGRDLFAVYRQLLFWFPIKRGYPLLRDMPVFVWDFGSAEDAVVHLDGFYGFPALDGPGGGVKLASESYERTTEPDDHRHEVTPAESARMYEECVAPRLPWLGSAPLRAVSCLYTSTLGSRFVIDRHPAHESVLIVSACSGHGFKHSPAIGEAIADWASGREPAIDLSQLSLSEVQRRGIGERFRGSA
jgi:sarcosine oxidase